MTPTGTRQVAAIVAFIAATLVMWLTPNVAHAEYEGREFVTADDIKSVAPYVLSHRMLLNSEAELGGHTSASLLKQITSAVPVPDDRGR